MQKNLLIASALVCFGCGGDIEAEPQQQQPVTWSCEQIACPGADFEGRILENVSTRPDTYACTWECRCTPDQCDVTIAMNWERNSDGCWELTEYSQKLPSNPTNYCGTEYE